MGPAGRERRWNSRLGLEVTEALQAHVYLQNMIHDVCALASVFVCVCPCTLLKSNFPFLLLCLLALIFCPRILTGRQRLMIWKCVLFAGFPEFWRNPGPCMREPCMHLYTRESDLVVLSFCPLHIHIRLSLFPHKSLWALSIFLRSSEFSDE